MDIDQPDLDRRWELPEMVPLRDISAVMLLSRIDYVGELGTTVEEEVLSVETDPFRQYMRTWYGRIVRFDLDGPPRPAWVAGWILAGAGSLMAMAGTVTVLLRRRG